MQIDDLTKWKIHKLGPIMHCVRETFVSISRMNMEISYSQTTPTTMFKIERQRVYVYVYASLRER